jgi:hypothetical protein
MTTPTKDPTKRRTSNQQKGRQMDRLSAALMIALHEGVARTRSMAARRRQDAGVSTLEMVIIALGLMAVAGLLVAAITAAVTTRTNQLQ